KVLAATARPLECDESVLTASLVAQLNNAKLLILHVLESNTSIYRNYVKHYRTGKEIVGDIFYQDEVKEELAKNCSSDIPPSLKYEIRIASGVPWMETLRWAREERVDLIILGAHTGRDYRQGRAAAHAAVGSTVEGVIKHERCPVMIATKPIPKSKVAFNKIMVGIDFSPSCTSAFQFALDLAQKRGSRLYLFHMLPVPPQPEYTQRRYETDLHKVRQRLEAEFSNQISGKIQTEIGTWGGVFPDIEILKYARHNDIDLIVMGSHTKIKGKLQEARWYVGSAVERVSAKSVCPVVVITDPKVLKKWEG
ncbi:MAG: universal stress protein, partial [Deltaproteobacteria bacterium]|nr:universal stress protein [Deltaproteobacteria bacterium]